MDKTYIFIGGLTPDQALEKIKKYYPDYKSDSIHLHALKEKDSCICKDIEDKPHIFGWDRLKYFQNISIYKRLDQMDRYYKFTTAFNWIAKNIEFKGQRFYSSEYFNPQNPYLRDHGSWGTSELKELVEITEEEYNKAKNIQLTVKLNADYSAIVTKENVSVGCQKFTHESILNLAKEIEKFLDKS